MSSPSPKELSTKGKVFYRRIAGLVQDPDPVTKELLSVLADTIAEYWQAQEVLEKEGYVLQTPTTRKAHPALAQKDRARASIRAYARLLGIGTQTETHEEASPLDEFMGD